MVQRVEKRYPRAEGGWRRAVDAVEMTEAERGELVRWGSMMDDIFKVREESLRNQIRIGGAG